MAKESLTPQQVFVNQNRKDAAKWMYRIVRLADGTSGSVARAVNNHSINELAAEGWEPFMMSSEAILLRRDATGAVDEEDTRQRAQLLVAISNLQ